MGSRAIHTVTMKYFAVILSVATCYAAPAADADPQLLLGGYHGLLGAAHVAAPAVATVAAAASVVTKIEAAPAVAAVHAAPAVAVHAAPAVVATAPVVNHVGYNVHHQVHHVPQVSVQKHVQTYTTQHVINHAPVVGAYHGLAPLAVAAPAVAVAAEAEVAAE